MKKLFRFISVFAVVLLLSGCVKYNMTLEIKEDKSMNMEFIMGTAKSLADQSTQTEEDKAKEQQQEEEMKKQGWTIEDYDDGSFVGKKYTKTVKNIDEVSTDKESEYDLNKIAEDGKEEGYMFFKKTENGKEIYKASFKFNTDSANQTADQTEDTAQPPEPDETEKEEEPATTSEPVVTVGQGEGLEGSEQNVTTTPSSEEQIANQLMGTMDLKLIVIAPNVTSHNATSTDGDKLIWDLTKIEKGKNIEFEFEIPVKSSLPIVPIAIGGGVVLLIVILVIALAGKKKKPEAPAVAPVETPVEPAPAPETPVETPVVEPAVEPVPEVVPETPVVETPVVETVEPTPVVEETPVIEPAVVEPVVETPAEPVTEFVETPVVEATPEVVEAVGPTPVEEPTDKPETL